MSALAALLLTLVPPTAQVLSVRSERLEARASVRVLTVSDLPPLTVRRRGGEVLLTLEAALPEDLAVPPPVAPVESIRVSREDAGLTFHIGVPAGLGLELRRERSSIVLLFGDPPAEETTADASLRHLYAQIFPVGWGGEAGEEPAAGLPAAAPSAEEEESWLLGAFSVRPGLLVSYINADTSLTDAPQPVRDDYFQVQPLLGLELSPFENNYLRFGYEPRFRFASDYSIVQTTTHLFTADANLPVGAYTLARGTFRHARGVLETTEVDPGREYFFGLGRFRHTSYGVGVRFKRGARFDLDGSLTWNQVKTASQSFFDYDSRRWTLALGYELHPNYRAALGYSYHELPQPAERPQAAFTSHSVHLTLEGDILPLVTGDVMVGYRQQDNPNAGPGGERYRGLVFGANLAKDFSPSSRLTLGFVRVPNPSAFQQNGFYVTTSGQADLTLPLPLYFSLRGGVGYQRNAYQIDVAELGEPRQDDIFAWSVGVGRGVTRWAFLRADYRRERRRSNLGAYDIDTDGFIVQVGIGRFGPAGAAR